ncbi:MAG: HupE/UreJ family protein, partial [Oceanospirillaceae bacterium]|nr:HupE/UreJ family protein [Oceanospirillaceae bacterium]
IPLALLMFNIGVETGQLLFVCGVVAIREILNRLPFNWPAGSWRVLPYAIGGTASFWVIERVANFV